MEENSTTIRVSQATVERLKRIGFKGETYDAILQRLLELVEREVPSE